MATQKPISTISYNTEAFLREKLDEYVASHIIQAYMYIKHKGEDGDKDHIHLRIEPNKRLDPMDLQDDLKEYVSGEKKPLGVRPFRPSKEEDWFLYVVHDPEYLAIKYGTDKDGKIEYHWRDIVATEGYDTEIAFIRAKQSLKHTAPSVIKQLESGVSAGKLIREGESPFIVGSVLRYLQNSEYEDLAKQYAELHSKYTELLSSYTNLSVAVRKAGYVYKSDDVTIIPCNVTF